MIVYLITALVLVIYLVLVAVFSPEAGKWTFRIIFWLLGLAGAGLFLWLYRRRNRPAQLGTSSLKADVVSLFRQAGARLAETRLGKKAKIGRLPVLIFLGEAGAAKTTAIVNSRTEPLHLAGQVYEENNIVSTPVVNLWLTGETIIAEVGPQVLEDPEAWAAFLRAVRPARLPALFSGREAPRSAVVSVSCERFLGQEAQDAAQSVARNLRTRVGELARSLGISLPVYVLFNKLDRIPSFLDFARNLTDNEATRSLGAAVAARDPRQAGVYSEQESQRLSQAFDGVYHGLAEQRLELLAREQAEEKLAGIYELPRDLAKLRTSMVGFLVNLLKPAQLAAEPFLRGFYFSGVRPVVVGDEAGRRRVPQWLYLPHLFSDVLLADLTTRLGGAASVGTRLGRRLLWAGATGVVALFLILATVSFFGNRQLVSRAVESARQTSAPARDPNGLPNAESLASVDRLRQSLSEIVAFRRDGRPLRLSWGLYIGDYMYPTLFRLYFDRFQRTLFSETHSALLNGLRKLPPRPGPEGEFQPAYERLKAYLCTTEIPHCSRRAFLSPVLLESWLAGREIDEDRLELARAQFDFYGDVLPIENPYSLESDGTTVRHAQNYLAQFGGFDRLYLQLLAAAAGDRGPIRFHELFPNAGKVITNKKEVHPAYTSDGWVLAAQGLEGLGGASADDACESHVLGPAAGSMDASADLRDRLLARYSEEYKKQWLEFLKATKVLGYGSPRDAAAKLETLAAVPNSSPLLALIWLASEHTAGGPPDVVEYFQPLQHVVPPGQEGIYLSDDNRQYMANLLRLQNAWSALAEDPRGAKNQLSSGGVRAAANAATDAANILAQGFTGDLSVATEARGILLAPIRTSQQYLVRLTTPSGDDLCRSFSALKRKYPFNPKASQEATVADIDTVFHPEFGALNALFENLDGAMVFDQSRRIYVARQGGELNLSPRFVAFFNRATAITHALYPEGASQPQFTYGIGPYPNNVLDRLELQVDGQVLSSRAAGGAPMNFVWPGQGGGVRLRIFPGGFEPQSHDGLWAVTRFFAHSSRYDRATGTYEWRPETSGQPMILNGKQVVIRYRVMYPSGVPFLQEGFLSDLNCVSRIVR